MQAPSLYSYFESKRAIYDAMFAQGARAYLEQEALVASTGDPLIFTRWGPYPATTTDDVLGPALAADAQGDFGSWSLRPDSGDIVRQLAELDITTLALMHGPAFTGDCPAALHGLADALDTRITG